MTLVLFGYSCSYALAKVLQNYYDATPFQMPSHYNDMGTGQTT